MLIIVFAVYNCIELPMEVAFNWRELYDPAKIIDKLNNLIDIMFFLDIVMNFRTSYFNSKTGEEVIEQKLI